MTNKRKNDGEFIPVLNTGIADISFNYEQAILSIYVLEGAEMTLDNTKRHYEEIRKLVGDTKYYALIDSSNYYRTDPSALQFAASMDAIGNRLASAHYNSSIANSLTVNYFKNIYSPHIPVRLFKTYEEALEWIISLKENLRR